MTYFDVSKDVVNGITILCGRRTRSCSVNKDFVETVNTVIKSNKYKV